MSASRIDIISNEGKAVTRTVTPQCTIETVLNDVELNVPYEIALDSADLVGMWKLVVEKIAKRTVHFKLYTDRREARSIGTGVDIKGHAAYNKADNQFRTVVRFTEYHDSLPPGKVDASGAWRHVHSLVLEMSRTSSATALIVPEVAASQTQYRVQWTLSGQLASTQANLRKDECDADVEYKASLLARATAEEIQPEEPDVDAPWPDSDDEADHYQATLSTSASAQTNADIQYRQITIKSAAFSTYQATLLWLQTGHITFAPLQPATAATQDAVVADRQTLYEESRRARPNLPLPISPKSVYRLAHLLQLPTLEALALAAFSSSLTNENVAAEYFGPVAAAYSELRSVTRAYIAEHWAEVKKTECWAEQKAKAMQGETQGGAQALGELFDVLF
ncbi:hypothetical protein JCM10908_007190 [Rhodotorula pacifica]|uniref:uncharacterized protein n=1 Tax=Rhodotorula pacifica TaxID=1495444 RepID=UPI00317D8D75